MSHTSSKSIIYHLSFFVTKLFYTTITQHCEHEIAKIKWSRFIGNIFPIHNKQEAEEKLKEVQKKYHNATHNCYAYVCGTKVNYDLFGNLEITSEYFKQSDEGEPTSTAGKPILAQIQGHKLHNILIVVTRYFGGTMLGVGGLIQAYGETAKHVIEHAETRQKEITKNIEFSYHFDLVPTVRNTTKKYHAKIIEEKYEEQVTMNIEINSGYVEDFKKELTESSKGQIVI